MNDEQKSKFDSIVNDAKVYEEDTSVFVLDINQEDEDQLDSTASEIGIVIDKFDYIRTQVEKINHPAIDNSKLLELMKSYYERV